MIINKASILSSLTHSQTHTYTHIVYPSSSMNTDNNHSARMQINKIIQDSIFTFILSNHYHYQLLIQVYTNNEKLRKNILATILLTLLITIVRNDDITKQITSANYEWMVTNENKRRVKLWTMFLCSHNKSQLALVKHGEKWRVKKDKTKETKVVHI